MNSDTVHSIDTVLMRDGIGRLAFVGGQAILTTGLGLISATVSVETLSPVMAAAVLIILISAAVLGWILTVLRIDNAGYSRWCILLLGVPLVHLLVMVALTIMPQGYRYHKTLDVAAGAIVAALAALVTIFIAFLILG
jgi:hypothetical protein